MERTGMSCVGGQTKMFQCIREYLYDLTLCFRSQLVDIHIYLVSPEQWRDHSRSAVSQVIGEAASSGFIR